MNREDIVTELIQMPQEDCFDSFWYDGDIAKLSLGTRHVLVVATGEVDIRDQEGNRYKYPSDVAKIGINNDKDLNTKVGDNYDDEYYWEFNNWFECLLSDDNDGTILWHDLMESATYDYYDALELARDILVDDSYWSEATL